MKVPTNKFEDIDVVLLWVDGNDRKWLDKKKHYSNENQHGDGSNRFRDWGTLRYLFRSISFSLPWIRKVHFVTEGHVPDWLDTSFSKLNIVKHDDFFSHDSNLPTFNSNAIDLNLANIKGLSERFVLFNDDTFVLNPTPIDRFFADSKTVDSLMFSFYRSNPIYKFIRGNRNATMLQNNIDLLNSMYSMHDFDSVNYFQPQYSLISNFKNVFFRMLNFGKIPWIEIYHHPQPHTKTAIEQVNKLFDNNVTLTKKNRFRTTEDITIYLARFYNLLSGNFVPRTFKDHLSLSVKNRNSLDNLDKDMEGINFFCVCDDVEFSDEDFEHLKSRLTSFFEVRFPDKCGFEK